MLIKSRFQTLAVAVVAVVSVALLVLPAVLRSGIDEQVRHQASVRLEGRLEFRKLGVSLLRRFPNISVELKDPVLLGRGAFAKDTLLSADRISIAITIGSLFGNEGAEVVGAVVVRPVVHARKLAGGAVNWNIMKPSGGADSPSKVRFGLRNVRIVEGALHYNDDSTHMRLLASPVSLRLRGDLGRAKTDLDVRLKAEDVRLTSGGMTLISGAGVQLDAMVDADMSKRRFVFLENTMRLNAISFSLEGWFDLAERDAVAMDIKADCSKVQFKDLLSMVPVFYNRDFNSLSASGGLSLGAWVRGKAKGSHLPAFEIELGVANGRFQYSSLPKDVTDIQVVARLSSPGGTFDNVVLAMPNFSAVVAGSPLRASLEASHPLSGLHINATAAGRLDLDVLHKVYPLDAETELSGAITADVRIGGHLSDIDSQRYEAVDVSGAFVVERMKARLAGVPEVVLHRAAATLSATTMTLGELSVKVGESDLTAKGQLMGYVGYLLGGEPLTGKLYVKSDLLDLNEMMTSLPDAKRMALPDTVAMAALIVPRNLNLTLSAEVRRILLHRMTFTDFSGEIYITDGTAQMSRLSMKAFGGTLLASGTYSTAADMLRPEMALALDIVHASFPRTHEEVEAVRSLAPVFRNAMGNYSMTLDMAARLDREMNPDLPTLRARGELRATNLRIPNNKTFSRLAEVLHDSRLRTAEASGIAIRFTVDEGRIATLPFDLWMGSRSIRFAGSTGLDGTIDYTASVSLPEEGGGAGQTIDVEIGGSASEPRVTLGVK